MNAIDLVYAVSQPKERSTAADTLRRLIKKKLFDESDITYVVHSQYKKIGIVSFAKAIKLLMVLGGKTARVEREKFARVLHLFYAGDAELKAEIDSNAISQEWLNVLAREALSAERVAATRMIPNPLEETTVGFVLSRQGFVLSRQGHEKGKCNDSTQWKNAMKNFITI